MDYVDPLASDYLHKTLHVRVIFIFRFFLYVVITIIMNVILRVYSTQLTACSARN